MSPDATLNYTQVSPTKVLFGAGTLAQLHTETCPGTKALLVISSGKSVKANGYLDRLIDELKAWNLDYVLYDKVGSNPTKEVVEAGAYLARQESCDCVVALGGGSVLDAAKVMALFAPQDSLDLWDFAGGATGKRLIAPKDPLPYVAITTSAGTGSEVDAVGVVSKLDTHEKVGVKDPRLFAELAIVDPELMLSVPKNFSAYQGFDALFHSVEGHISTKTNLVADMYQMEAITNIGAYLPRVIEDGQDLEARTHVAFANTLSGYSMVMSGLTSQHPMEHALSALSPQLPHGAGLILLSDAFFSFWAERGAASARMVEMARALGKTNATSGTDFVDALKDLRIACGVNELDPATWGLSSDNAEQLTDIVRATYGEKFPQDPAPMSKQEMVEIFKRALS